MPRLPSGHIQTDTPKYLEDTAPSCERPRIADISTVETSRGRSNEPVNRQISAISFNYIPSVARNAIFIEIVAFEKRLHPHEAFSGITVTPEASGESLLTISDRS